MSRAAHVVALALCACGQPAPTEAPPPDLGGFPDIKRLVHERIGCDLERARAAYEDDDPWECTIWLGPCNCSIAVRVMAKPPREDSEPRPARTDDLRVTMIGGTVKACPDGNHIERVLGLLMARIPPPDWKDFREFSTTILGGLPPAAFAHEQVKGVGRFDVTAAWSRFLPSPTSSELDHEVSLWSAKTPNDLMVHNYDGGVPLRRHACRTSL